MKIAPIFALAILIPLRAQDLKIPANLDKLAAKAEESVDVSLEGPMLRLAGRIASGKDADGADIAKLISGLQSITVKSFEFSSDGQYDMADVDAIRAQLKAPLWSRIVAVASKRDGENADVYFKDGGNGNLGGVVVLCAGSRELTVVSIVGTIDPARLAEMGGHFGIPRLELGLGAEGKKDGK